MGTTLVKGFDSDGTCYFCDQIQVVAFPESGVKFEHWSDVTTNKQLVRDIVVKEDMTIEPVFTGEPTGIEDIEGVTIAAGNESILVRGAANADVTIVNMVGRIQAKQRVNGDTRIAVPAGIYVVVVENGDTVRREKVIVK